MGHRTCKVDIICCINIEEKDTLRGTTSGQEVATTTHNAPPTCTGLPWSSGCQALRTCALVAAGGVYTPLVVVASMATASTLVNVCSSQSVCE